MVKSILTIFLALAVSSGTAFASVPERLFNNSHDVTMLKAWGPYSKMYSGISRIEDVDSGNRVDITLVPGLYRRSYLVPNALYESGCYPWKVSPDIGRICWRYELEWKDRLYVDATYHVLSDSLVLLQMHCVNATEVTQNILLQTMASVHFADEKNRGQEDFFPEWSENALDFTVKYKAMENWYGVATNYPLSSVKRYENGLLDYFIRRTVHRHPPVQFRGDNKGHYTSEFQRPVVLAPQSDTTIWNLIVCGSKDFVAGQIEAFHRDESSFTSLAAEPEERKCLPKGEDYAFGEQIIEATLLTNIAYPIVAEGQNIRHFTPGKNWNSLYTWDSGFISWALACLDPVKSFETIRAYTTAPGSQQAFIHHGTPLPTQFFAFEELLSKTSDKEMAAFLYPRLKQYYDYFAGHDARSNTMMPSGFVRTWDLWYSTGGWDDYPPQHWLRSHEDLYASVAPAVSGSFYIRAAKILRLTASILGYKSDIKQYDKDIARMSKAILGSAWDEEAGYFSYVTHGPDGKPDGFLRAADGSNFNKGLDGTSPLAAGICTPGQQERLLDNLFSAEKLWTPYGISTVDQSASYYSLDGYWNGCVWMPHQFVLWKAMLDLGLPERARQIAFTALNAWKKETELSYLSCEHFIIASGRGAGWHNFSGLSSPMVNWFYAYFKPGTVTAGFDAICVGPQFGSGDKSDGSAAATHGAATPAAATHGAAASSGSGAPVSFETDLLFDKDSYGNTVTLLVCLDSGRQYGATVNGRSVTCSSPYPGLIEVSLKSVPGRCHLEVR